MIRPVHPADAARVAEIYNHYVLTSVITFEEVPVTVPAMEARIAETTKSGSWLVHEQDGRVAGYAYLAPWKARSAYRFSAECTAYVDHGCLRAGIGRALYAELFKLAEAAGLHRVIAGIALPNERSQGLHESFGFRKVAHFSEVGFKMGRWVDVGYWEREV
jgi:phosphinothricin acetyltransferase